MDSGASGCTGSHKDLGMLKWTNLVPVPGLHRAELQLDDLTKAEWTYHGPLEIPIPSPMSYKIQL